MVVVVVVAVVVVVVGVVELGGLKSDEAILLDPGGALCPVGVLGREETSPSKFKLKFGFESTGSTKPGLFDNEEDS